MKDDRLNDPQEEGQAIDPPNNTEPGSSLLGLDGEAPSIDPPNNTDN